MVRVLQSAPSVAPAALMLLWSTVVAAHPQGFEPTQEAAEQRARELGCEGTHRNRGRWMPCKDEAHLHQELRNQ
jgi:hypothetical protein